MRSTLLLNRRQFGGFVAAGAATLAAPAVRAQGQLIRFATEGANPPWNFVTPQGRVEGIDIDIANAICQRLGARCEVAAQAWDGIIPGLLARRYDAIIAGMAMTPARRERVAFSDVYRKIISSFVARKGTVTDVSPAALRGKRIGVQRGASQQLWLERNGYGQTATIVLYDTVATSSSSDPSSPETSWATARGSRFARRIRSCSRRSTGLWANCARTVRSNGSTPRRFPSRCSSRSAAPPC
jgi:ABC-type amino acid transport substrate-binding protein